MSGTIDPATGKPLPADAIQRVLFICHPVHVYAIPPLTSMKGYTAADWTVPDPKNNGRTREIFTARLRIMETAIPTPVRTRAPNGQPATELQEKVKVDILLEEPETGNLFAAAPYTDPGVVEHALDSSRFFAVRVVGEGRKAVLGIGFEQRSETFDFSVTLQEARKVLGFWQEDTSASSAGGPRGVPGRRGGAPQPEPPAQEKDYSLKPGETISINIGRKGTKTASEDSLNSPGTNAREEEKALFSIPPPPPPPGPASSNNDSSALNAFAIPPPPPPNQDRRRRPPSTIMTEESVNKPFDDDADFGDFQ